MRADRIGKDRQHHCEEYSTEESLFFLLHFQDWPFLEDLAPLYLEGSGRGTAKSVVGQADQGSLGAAHWHAAPTNSPRLSILPHGHYYVLALSDLRAVYSVLFSVF